MFIEFIQKKLKLWLHEIKLSNLEMVRIVQEITINEFRISLQILENLIGV